MPWQIRKDPLDSPAVLALLREHLATLAPTCLLYTSIDREDRMTTTTKRSGAINWPVLIIIAIFAGLAAVDVYKRQEKLRLALSGWGGDALACELAQTSADPGDQARLVAAATIVNGQGCTGLAAAGGTVAPGVAATAITGQDTAAADDGGSNLLPLLLLGLLLFLLLLAILYVWNRRRRCV